MNGFCEYLRWAWRPQSEGLESSRCRDCGQLFASVAFVSVI